MVLIVITMWFPLICSALLNYRMFLIIRGLYINRSTVSLYVRLFSASCCRKRKDELKSVKLLKKTMVSHLYCVVSEKSWNQPAARTSQRRAQPALINIAQLQRDDLFDCKETTALFCTGTLWPSLWRGDWLLQLSNSLSDTKVEPPGVIKILFAKDYIFITRWISSKIKMLSHLQQDHKPGTVKNSMFSYKTFIFNTHTLQFNIS